MVIRVVEISSGGWGGYKIRKIFCLQIKLPKENFENFETWCSGELSKIEQHFSSKLVQKLILSRNVDNKKCASKLVFINEKKN